MIFRQSALTAGLLGFLVAGCSSAAKTDPPPTLVVEAAYPGADAQVVADVVAAPIEQQVLGVEKMLWMRSQCRDDGSYRLVVAFDRGVDLNVAQVLVQNRVSLALPVLPDQIVKAGVTVKKESPGALLIVALVSPDLSLDEMHLGNYAAVQVRDELIRVPGVGEVTLLPQHEQGTRVWLQPERMTAHNLTAGDVLAAIKQQNVQVGPQTASPFSANAAGIPLVLSTPGRSLDADKYGDIILKTDAQGNMVRLKDVARIESGISWRGYAVRDGKPAVLLSIFALPRADPRRVVADVQGRLTELIARFPKGIAAEVAFAPPSSAPRGQAAPDYLLLDVALPTGVSEDRARQVLERLGAVCREVDGVQGVLAMSESPFDPFRQQPCVLLRLAPAANEKNSRKQLIQTIRSRLETLKDASVGLRELSGPSGVPSFAYPVQVAIYGPDQRRVKDLAVKLAERLRQDKRLLDVGGNWESSRVPRIVTTVDRDAAGRQGVALGDVLDTLKVGLGPAQTPSAGASGRTEQLSFRKAAEGGDPLENLKRLTVRSAQGQMVPLDRLVTLTYADAPDTIDRHDGRPMAEITANLAKEASPAEIRTRCLALFDEVRKEVGLPAEYGLTWR